MESLFCFNCGAKLEAGTPFCTVCGTDNREGAGTQAAGQPWQQPYPAQQQMQQPYSAQPYMYQQNSYMQPQQNAQQYYGTQYIPGMGMLQKPSLASKIIGTILILLGIPLTLLFGLATLGLFAEGETAAWIVLLFITLMSACLIWIGARQFKPRMIQQMPNVMPMYNNMQQPYAAPPQMIPQQPMMQQNVQPQMFGQQAMQPQAVEIPQPAAQQPRYMSGTNSGMHNAQPQMFGQQEMQPQAAEIPQPAAQQPRYMSETDSDLLRK